MLRYLTALNRTLHSVNVRLQYASVVTARNRSVLFQLVTEVTKQKEKSKGKTQTTQLHAT